MDITTYMILPYLGTYGLKYHLPLFSSSAINQWVVIPKVTDGYDGSNPDKGPYEYGGTEWVLGCIDSTKKIKDEKIIPFFKHYYTGINSCTGLFHVHQP
jgi:hypothetical protein